MGRRKFVLGRIRKNFEKKRQEVKGRKPGRPRKNKKVYHKVLQPLDCDPVELVFYVKGSPPYLLINFVTWLEISNYLIGLDGMRDNLSPFL